MTQSPQSPATLLQMAGARPRPNALDQSVLVLIDAQNDYLDGSLPLAGIKPAIAETARLLAAARAAGTPVIHIVHHAGPGAVLFDPEGRGSQIVADLTPLPAEEVMVKRLPNAFAGTPLRARLETLAEGGRKGMIVAGFMTHMCVSSTVRAALDLGIPATVVARATATRDLPDPAGGVVSADTVQRAALAALADRFCTIVQDVDALTPATA